MHRDPEGTAAAYLAGELGRRGRSRFERHMLECEDCWHEVSHAREGRMIAESLREVSPPALRDRIRGVPSLAPQPVTRPRPRRPFRIATSIAAAAVAITTLLITQPTSTQPAPLAAAAALYRTDQADPAGMPLPARILGAYRWQGSAMRDLNGIPATVHTYTDQAGHRLLVIVSTQPFPRASNAEPVPPEPSWIAEVDGTVMLCADQHGTSWLAVAPNRADALTAGQTLGLM